MQKDSDDASDKKQGQSFNRTGGLRPLKEGWCFKQGAVVSILPFFIRNRNLLSWVFFRECLY